MLVGHAFIHFSCFAAGATSAGGHQPTATWHSGRKEGPLPPAAEDGLPGGAPVPGGVGGVARPGLHKRHHGTATARVSTGAAGITSPGGGVEVPRGVGGVARPGLTTQRQLRPAAAWVSGEDASPGGGQVPGGAGRCPRPSVTTQRHPGQQPGQVRVEPGPDVLARSDWLRRLVRESGVLPSQTDSSSNTKAWRLSPSPGARAVTATAGK